MKDKEDNEKMLQERNQNIRCQMKEGVFNKVSETHNKKKEKAEMVKYEKMEVNEVVNMQKQQDQLKNASIKQMIKNQEMEN